MRIKHLLPSSAKSSKASAEFSLNLKLLLPPLAGQACLAGLADLAGLAGLEGLARQAGPELGSSQPQLVFEH